MDFDLGNKHERNVRKRREEAQKKLEQHKQDEQIRAAMEEEHRFRAVARQQEVEVQRARAECEALMNSGVRYVARLAPFPSARPDDKLVLPASVLAELMTQNALELGPLTFGVSLLDQNGRSKSASSRIPDGDSLRPFHTHAGVAEFVAAEGFVGVPPRVALSLVKSAGLTSLAAIDQVEIRYVRLPRVAKCSVKLQPRGEGFHAGGAAVVQMDLEHVLQEALRGHTALTEGDWLPIRHDGRSYELVVRELSPEPAVLLVDTDLKVEVMPSEETEAQGVAEEQRKLLEEALNQALEDKEVMRLERARQLATALPPEPTLGPSVVHVLVRLPSGGRISRRFRSADLLRSVFFWVEAEPDSRVQSGDFRLMQRCLGHFRELGPSEADQNLDQLEFSRQEALLLQMRGDDAVREGADLASVPLAVGPEVAMRTVEGTFDSAWTTAVEHANEALDRRLGGETTPSNAAAQEPALEAPEGPELVRVFERLVALGLPPQQAAAASKKYAAQLLQLAAMGFEDWIEAVQLLERYGGRLLRVANLLSEKAAMDVDLPAVALLTERVS